MDRETAKEYLINAARLLKNELWSFGENICERTIMCRLAHHLATDVEKSYSNLQVDCEYNRDGDDIKKYHLPSKVEDVGAGYGESRRFFPDIVIHERRVNGQNILACEIKKSNTPNHCLDHLRLEKLTCPKGGFRYRIGVFLEIDQAGRCVYATYFKNGKKCGERKEISAMTDVAPCVPSRPVSCTNRPLKTKPECPDAR